MPNTILHKRNSTPGTVPPATGLSQGELGINIADGKFYTKNSSNVIINLGVTSISGTSITPASGLFSSAVGVGTTTPNANLTVYSAINGPPSSGNRGAFNIEFSTTNGLSLGTYATAPYSNYIQSMGTAGAPTYPLALNPIGGNVGINTVDPSGKFHIESVVSNNSYVLLSSPGNVIKTHIGVGNSDSVPFLASTNNIQLASGTFGWGFFDRSTDGNLHIQRKSASSSWASVMMMDRSNGNVGIGTGVQATTPPEKLTVDGSIRLADTATSIGNRLQLYRGGGSAYDYTLSKEGSHIAISTASDPSSQRALQVGYHSGATFNPKFHVNGYTGDVGIGTTTPSTLLEISKDGGGVDLALVRIANTNATGGTALKISRTGPQRAAQIIYQSGTTDQFYQGILRDGGSTTNGWSISAGADLNVVAPAIHVTSGNYVGIGTKSPQALLHVNGQAYLQSLNLTGGTADRILATDTNKTITFLNTSTYPTLTELSYVKDVTSSIQTQINSKQNTLTNPVTGTGTNGKLSKWSSTSTLTDSILSESSTVINIAGSFNSIVDDTYLSFDANARRIGITKKGGFTGKFTYGSGSSFAIAQSNSGTIEAANTFTDRFVIDSNGNVGIGTSSPSYKLDVAGDAEFGSNNWLKLIDTGSNNGRLAFSAAGSIDAGGTFMFRNNAGSTEHMRITTGGDVGIGISSPSHKLHVSGVIRSTSHITSDTEFRLNNSAFSRVATMDGAGAFAGGYNVYLSGSTPKHSTSSPISSYYYYSDGTIRFYTNSSQSADTNASERLRISDSGNVGIGTTSPQALLHVNGQAYLQSLNLTGGTADRILATDTNKTITFLNTSTYPTLTELSYVKDVTSSIQTQINSKQNTLTNPVTGTGTNGKLSKWSSTSTLTDSILSESSTVINIAGSFNSIVDDTYLSFDANARRIGITKKGGFTGKFTYGSGSSFAIAQSNSGTIEAANTFTDRFVIDSNGNVGIGTSSPSYKLDVAGDAEFGSNNWLKLIDTGSNNGRLAFSAAGSIDAGGTFMFRNNAGSTEHMRITTGGDVGIGISSPSHKLHVSGVIRSTSHITSDTEFRLNNSAFSRVATMDGAGAFAGGYNVYLSGSTPKHSTSSPISSYYYYSDGTIRFYTNSSQSADTNASERLRITSAGDVGIGTTTPGYKLQVNGSFAASTKSFRIDHPSKSGWNLEYGSLESPYHGVRLTGRGTVIKGVGVVSLPVYLKDLIHDDDTLNIQITNIKHGKTIYLEEIDLKNDQFIVKVDRAKSLGELQFCWTLSGVRKDVDHLVVEKEN